MLGAGDLGGFPEEAGDAFRQKLVVHIAHGWAGAKTGCCVGLTAFCRHPQLVDRTFFALDLGRHVDELFRSPACSTDRLEVTFLFDRELGNILSGCPDAVSDALGPFWLDADDDNRVYVWVGAGSDDSAEMRLEVFAKLQTTIGVRDRHGAFDVVGYRLTGRVRDVINGQNDHVVADTDASVFAAEALERDVGIFRHREVSLPALGFDVVSVDMTAFGDIRDNLADVLTVFDRSVAILEVFQRDFVADRNICARCQAEGRIVMGNAAEHVGACGQALDHDDADIVGLFMHQQVWHFIGNGVGHLCLRLGGFQYDFRGRNASRAYIAEGLRAVTEGACFSPVKGAEAPVEHSLRCVAEVLSGIGICADKADFL